MIRIKQSKTADTRTCDVSLVTKETLLKSSVQHIDDVRLGLDLFINMLTYAQEYHDADKLSGVDQFHSDFKTKFEKTGWWDNHRKVNRHHLLADDGVPENVNLIDVIEMIVDCTMAGMARAGSVYPLEIKPEVLMKAFKNTAELMLKNVEVIGKDE